jgi:hypothetical protein
MHVETVSSEKTQNIVDSFAARLFVVVTFLRAHNHVLSQLRLLFRLQELQCQTQVRGFLAGVVEFREHPGTYFSFGKASGRQERI